MGQSTARLWTLYVVFVSRLIGVNVNAADSCIYSGADRAIGVMIERIHA
jgi:hypothetical protein